MIVFLTASHGARRNQPVTPKISVPMSLYRGGHQHPNNIWALRGYHECLTLLGRTAEAKLLELPLKLATCLADIPVQPSLFWRTNTQKVSVEGKKSCNISGSCQKNN
ncbi:hypothetical protein V8C34DRAFT_113587 [Trichoderma compactum]